MTHIFTAKKIFMSLFLLTATCFTATAASAQTIKIATLSPGGSYWVKSFKEGADEIATRTEGRVKFKFYPGGVMGGDLTVLRKMNIGQLQGGAMAGGALYGQYPDASLLGIPFTFDSQEEMDFARKHLEADIKNNALEKGFVILGVMGGGPAYILSQKKAKSFDDVKTHKVWVPDNDPQTADTLKKLGLNPVPLGVGDVLTGLQTGLIDTVAASPVVAIALQWHTRVHHMIKVPILYITGVLVLNQRDFKKLAADDQKIVQEVFGRVAENIHQRNIQDNDKAYNAMIEQGINIIEPQGADLKTWQDLKKEARALILSDSQYNPKLMTKLETLKTEYKNLTAQKAH